MHPSHFARTTPDKLALIMPETGERLTYAELDAAANQASRLYRAAGLERGDTVAMLSDNCVDYYTAWWGAQQAGLYFNGMPTSASVEETAWVVGDCDAKALILSAALGEPAQRLAREARTIMPGLRAIYALGGELAGAPAWREALASMSPSPIDDPSAGALQPYSSGSTGKPKGLRHPLPQIAHDALDPLMALWVERFGFHAEAPYMAPGPLSHGMTLSFSSLAQRVGATVIQMARFEPGRFMDEVETYRAAVSLMTPMMFVRLLKTPQAERDARDMSSLRSVVHAAASCPPGIKRAMIDWWGPILNEFYSGSEGWGCTIITSQEWLQRPGSVGRPVFGQPHVCGDDGEELPAGQIGDIYFDSRSTVRVLNDPAKTEAMRHPVHKTWGSFGDVGYLDADGHLYLVDRRIFVVESGGRRLYPQETEDLLIAHPRVADAAVFGVPDAELGEKLKAAVLPLDPSEAGPALAEELLAYCRARLSPEKCPPSIEFEPALPRTESGKLLKRRLQEPYRA